MKKLSKISLEAMEKELQVLESPQAILGGVVRYPSDAKLNFGTDCVFKSIAYLNGNITSEEIQGQIKADYFQKYYNPAGGIGRDKALEMAEREMANSTGANMELAKSLFASYVGNGSSYNASIHQSQLETAMDEWNHEDPMLATINTKNDRGEANHAVTVIDFKSGVFTFWDAQNSCSGTFEWDDLRYMLIGSGNA